MKTTSREGGGVLLEVLLLLLVLSMVSRWAVPEAMRIYKYGAVRYEAEQLLSELRYEQMTSRTAVQVIGEDGSTVVSSTRPRLLMTGKGYIIYRGSEIVKRHSCISPVKMQFGGNWSGREQIMYFNANGDIYPNVTIKVFAAGGISCRLVVDSAGRFRLERTDAGG